MAVLKDIVHPKMASLTKNITSWVSKSQQLPVQYYYKRYWNPMLNRIEASNFEKYNFSKSLKLYIISNWRWLKVKLISVNNAIKQHTSLFDDFSMDLGASVKSRTWSPWNRSEPWRKRDHFSITSFCTKGPCTWGE